MLWKNGKRNSLSCSAVPKFLWLSSLWQKLFTASPPLSHPHLWWVRHRGSKRDVIYLGWPIASSYMNPNARGGGEGCGCQWEQLCTSPNKLWRSNSMHIIQWLGKYQHLRKLNSGARPRKYPGVSGLYSNRLLHGGDVKNTAWHARGGGGSAYLLPASPTCFRCMPVNVVLQHIAVCRDHEIFVPWNRGRIQRKTWCMGPCSGVD
jgi:hypothetical protein